MLFEKAALQFGFEPRSFHFNEINFCVQDGRQGGSFSKFPIRNFSLIIVRNCWGYEKQMSLLGAFCRSEKIPLIDSVLYSPFFDSKLAMIQTLAANNISVPNTLWVQNKADFCRSLPLSRFPLLAKSNLEGPTHDVHFLHKPDDFKFSFQDYHFQEFIPAGVEIRIMIVGEKTLGAVEVPSSRQEARSIPCTPYLESCALKACQLLHFEFASVDVLKHQKSGKFYVIDVNRCPEFRTFSKVTGVDAVAVFMEYCKKYQ